MNHGSLFSGIGGFDLAAEWMGWENIFHCEWNQFGQKVLKHYWPNAISYDDICKTDFTIWNGRIDILTGGFPCQPYSMAGKRKGTEDSRHLWPEMLRAIRECRPTWIVGENVPGLINWSGGLVFEQVCLDLEGEGYEVQPVVLPASGVNAPHRRDRVWFVARCITADTRLQRQEIGQFDPMGIKQLRSERPTQNPNEDGWGGDERKKQTSIGQFGDIGAGDNERIRTDHAEVGVVSNPKGKGSTRRTEREESTYSINGGTGENGDAANTGNEGLQRWQFDGTPNEKGQIRRKQPSRPTTKRHKITDWTDWPTVAPLCDVNDGLPDRLDGITFPKWRNESIKAGGNAIVPQVALQIFKVIDKMQQSQNQ